MEKFRINFTIQGHGGLDTDIDIKQSIFALDEIKALEQARHLIKTNNPNINTARIWSWSIERAIDRDQI